MTVATQLQSKVAALIDTYGDSINYYDQTGSTFNEEGDLTYAYASGSSAKAIPSTINKFNENETQGPMPNADITFLCSGAMPMDRGYKITHNSIDYEVEEVKPTRLQNVDIYNRATCNQIIT